MCGIFGVSNYSPSCFSGLLSLAKSSKRRGMDSSGFFTSTNLGNYRGIRADYSVDRLFDQLELNNISFLMGHSRLITNGLSDNQPVWRDDVCVIHNGIIIDDTHLWTKYNLQKRQEIDTEILAAFTHNSLSALDFRTVLSEFLETEVKGTISCAIAIPRLGKLLLYSNNSSLYVGHVGESCFFASEQSFLEKLNCSRIKPISDLFQLDIPISTSHIFFKDIRSINRNLIPSLKASHNESLILKYHKPRIRRCSKCILPETMPFIRFDLDGICNYCTNYTPRLKDWNLDSFYSAISPFIDPHQKRCILPFSGGRDSTLALHLVVKELGLTPVTMTYDWGMVTDLARRNISRVCSILGVQNIIIADDIAKKRSYIAKNLAAWLKRPHLGMLNILMAGDKHFFRHIETIKKELDCQLNIWGMNPLETTHFKAGFLGFPPSFDSKQVFYTGIKSQLLYHSLRLFQYLKNPAYINESMIDTYLGEYYRSIHSKTGFFNIFDYYKWDEKSLDSVLDTYEWERAPDTSSTWRIGDGTAAFYNYVFFTVAGFTEFDTFRSNQIREGVLDRETALSLVENENFPRYSNIKWYLDSLGFDFTTTIRAINAIPKAY